MRKASCVLVLASLLAALFVHSALAATGWEDPTNYQSPSVYAAMGRTEYTRQHWVDFYVDDGGGRTLRFANRASVFDMPQSLTNGMTAVGPQDPAYQPAIFVLDALGVPVVDGYYIVSPGFWKLYYQQNGSQLAGATPPLSSSGEMILDVPVGHSENGFPDGSKPSLSLGDTVNNPRAFKNGPDGYRAGGYAYSKTRGYYPWYWWSESAKSPAGLTKRAAIAGATDSYTSRAEITYSYLYNLSVFALEPVGQPSNGYQTWRVTVVNSTPFVAVNVRLRAYTIDANGVKTTQPAAQTVTDIGPLPLGNGFGGLVQPTVSWRDGTGVTRTAFSNTINWTFQVQIPGWTPGGQVPPYKVLVSANVNFDGASGVTEPLDTEVAYGHNADEIIGLTSPKDETKPMLTPPNNTVDSVQGKRGYIDNYAIAGYGQAAQALPDYVARYVKVYTSSGALVPDGGTVLSDAYYRIEAEFVQANANFTQGQFVRVAIGVEDNGTKVLKADDAMWFPGPNQPQRLVVDSYRFGDPAREVLVFGSVNGDQRVQETDYANNRAYARVRVSATAAGDLMATLLLTGAPAGGSDYDVAAPGSSYTATAKFKSTFSIPGYAYVRLYWKTMFPAEGSVTLVKEQRAYFDPGAEVTLTGSWIMPSNAAGGVLYATVAQKWTGSGWASEPFEGTDGKTHNDVDQSNNALYRSVSTRANVTSGTEQKYLREITRTENVTVTRTVWYQDGVWVIQEYANAPNRVRQEVLIVQ